MDFVHLGRHCDLAGCKQQGEWGEWRATFVGSRKRSSLQSLTLSARLSAAFPRDPQTSCPSPAMRASTTTASSKSVSDGWPGGGGVAGHGGRLLSYPLMDMEFFSEALHLQRSCTAMRTTAVCVL
jgi:hypothetical protein